MRSTATGWLLLLPTMIVLFVMGVFTFIYVLVISFFDWNAFAADPSKQAQWEAYMRNLSVPGPELGDVVSDLRTWLAAIFE